MTVSEVPVQTEKRSGYFPYGAAWDLLHYQGPEVIISGPAGTGKSVAALFKLHLCADTKKGFRGLILRKTRASLTDSALVSFERFVLPKNHPARVGPKRGHRTIYFYPHTEAEIRVEGLDMPSRLMSAEYNMIFVQETIEVSEDDWEFMATRLRDLREPPAMSYTQLVGDTNPGAPTHWIKQRQAAGKLVILESRHQDNPILWDESAKDWTEQGHKYIGRLDTSLTGAKKERLRYGRWVQAEGVVYESWDRRVHLLDRDTLRKLGVFDLGGTLNRHTVRRVVAGVDWGFTNAGVILVGAIDGDGRLYVVYDLHRTGQTIDWWIAKAREVKQRFGVGEFVCDPSEPAYIEQFRRAGLPAVTAFNEVEPGINMVRARLVPAKDGRRRLYFWDGCLAERDQGLLEQKRPVSTIEEFDSYVLKPQPTSKTPNAEVREEPVKENDHGCDALRYLVAHLDRKGGGSVFRPTVLTPGPMAARPVGF